MWPQNDPIYVSCGQFLKRLNRHLLLFSRFLLLMFGFLLIFFFVPFVFICSQASVPCLHVFSVFLQHLPWSVFLSETYFDWCYSWRDVPWTDTEKCLITWLRVEGSRFVSNVLISSKNIKWFPVIVNWHCVDCSL